MVKMYGAILAISSQQVSGGSAPTGVSIASAPSNNYDNACVFAEVVDGSAPDCHDFSPSASFNLVSGNLVASKSVDVADFSGFNGVAAVSDIEIRAYCRATDATSFQWTISIHADTSIANGTVAVQTAGGTAQDSTGQGNDAVGKVRMTFGGSKAGFTFPENDDELAIQLDCTATNSSGSTNAVPIVFKFKYSS